MRGDLTLPALDSVLLIDPLEDAPVSAAQAFSAKIKEDGGMDMARLIEKPTTIKAAGNPPKEILEYVGLVNTGTEEMSLAKMRSPQGWEEPPQIPEFDECTLVLKGTLRAEIDGREVEVRAGQALWVEAGEKVRYATPDSGGAEYVSVCLPAFSPETVHRSE